MTTPPSMHAIAPGFTLVELLVALAIGAVILLPLADLLRSSADSAQMVRTRLDLHAEAAFALERIASKAARTVLEPNGAAKERAPKVEDETRNWLAKLDFQENKGSRQLLEKVVDAKPPANAIIAADVARIELTSPETDGATPTLRIALTLAGADTGAPAVARVRTVRIGVTP